MGSGASPLPGGVQGGGDCLGEFDRQYSVRVCPPLLWVTPKLERAHFRCSHSLQEGHTAVVIASDVLMVVPDVVSSRYGGGV